MANMTGGQAAIATLRAHGVDVVFGIPGAHTLPLYDAMYAEPGLRHVLARHEQGAGYMAYGYARATGKPGVVCTISGPGVTNVVTPAANAYADSTPVLILSSGLRRAAAGGTSGGLHELKDQLGLMREVVGWAHAVATVEEIPQAIRDAFAYLTSRRPRSAYLEIPLDLLAASGDVEIPEPKPVSPPAYDAEAVRVAAGLLLRSRSPLIIAGAGVSAAAANSTLLRLAESLGAPVLLGAKSRDVAPTEHPLVIATTGYAMSDDLIDLIANSDAALVVGSRLGDERTAGRRLPLPADLVHVDIDADEIGRRYQAAVGIVADAGPVLTALADAAGAGRPSGRQAEVRAVRAAQDLLVRKAFGDSLTLLDAVRDALAPSGVVVADMTRMGYASARYLPVTEPRTFVHSSEFCAIGCGLPIGLGAKVGAPDRPVVVLAGDGGVVLNIGELAAAAQEGIDVVVIVFNDGAYTAVRMEQESRYGRRYLATDVRAPDFVELAQAYGVRGVRARDAEELRAALTAAIARGGTSVIDVPLSAVD